MSGIVHLMGDMQVKGPMKPEPQFCHCGPEPGTRLSVMFLFQNQRYWSLIDHWVSSGVQQGWVSHLVWPGLHCPGSSGSGELELTFKPVTALYKTGVNVKNRHLDPTVVLLGSTRTWCSAQRRFPFPFGLKLKHQTTNDFWKKKASVQRKTQVSSSLTPHWTLLPTKHCYSELSMRRNVLCNLCNHDNDLSLWHHVFVGTGSLPLVHPSVPTASLKSAPKVKGQGGRGQSLGQGWSKGKARKPQIISFDFSH